MTLSEMTASEAMDHLTDTRPQSPGVYRSPRLKVVIVGHVDHGKSTLIGRIFYDTDTLPEGKVESIRKACEAEGMPFEYAFLLDALLEEQEQNITIDTTQIPFKTAKRGYTIIDAPGHTEFLKNMVTGAASADAAILLIAASEGVREQSRRHGYLLRLLGMRQVVVAVNKMDLVGFDEGTFRRLEAEYREFLSQIGLDARLVIPVSAREGANIARQAREEMPWYDGPTILDALDSMETPRAQADLPLRFPIQDVYRFDARRILAGRIETGTIRVGDRLVFAPGGRESVVASIERWNGPGRDYAVAGESIGVTLTEQLFVERGHIAARTSDEDAPQTASRVRANVFWMGKTPLAETNRYRLKLATQELDARVAVLHRVIDASTLTDDTTGEVRSGDVAEVTLEVRGRNGIPLAFDPHEHLPTLGRFVLVNGGVVAGGGILLGAAEERRREAPVSGNITWSDAPIAREERARRNGHRGAVVWLTGLSGSGKSTLANGLVRSLFDRDWQGFVLDGDNLRFGLNKDLGFSPENRAENIRRAAHVAALMAEAGQVVVTAFISPYRADREQARAIVEEAGLAFVEVFVDAPLRVCEERDPKGLYRKARAGEITGFTGIDAPYEAPQTPEYVINSSQETPSQSVSALLEYLTPRLEI